MMMRDLTIQQDATKINNKNMSNNQASTKMSICFIKSNKVAHVVLVNTAFKINIRRRRIALKYKNKESNQPNNIYF